jgi:hypothetical protein
MFIFVFYYITTAFFASVISDITFYLSTEGNMWIQSKILIYNNIEYLEGGENFKKYGCS